MAEEVGFEPTVGCPTHDFQSCRFGRSRTPPRMQPGQASREFQILIWGSLQKDTAPVLGAVAGSCATAARESSQGRKTAALSGYGRVP
jgi:hypothetical protein